MDLTGRVYVKIYWLLREDSSQKYFLAHCLNQSAPVYVVVLTYNWLRYQLS